MVCTSVEVTLQEFLEMCFCLCLSFYEFHKIVSIVNLIFYHLSDCKIIVKCVHNGSDFTQKRCFIITIQTLFVLNETCSYNICKLYTKCRTRHYRNVTTPHIIDHNNDRYIACTPINQQIYINNIYMKINFLNSTALEIELNVLILIVRGKL